MTLSLYLAQIQKPSWWNEPTCPRNGMSARNAKYAAEKEKLYSVIASAGRIDYEELIDKTGLMPRTIGNYMRKLSDAGKVIVYRSRGKKYAEIVRG